ncbi:MAG: transporter substrate-binding domain-containing protein [Magnetococcales bacterium]|nr:transporter substrate-binding domain-containing protein [Magnetococcales bacterium]
MGLFFLSALVLFQNMAAACTLTMGYRTNERLPLIGKHPDASGLYSDLYRKAAEKVGCSLEVVRQPKKVVLKMLKDGRIDFYPGFNFTEKRAVYTFYIENGLPGGDIGVSHADLAEVTDLSQLQGKTMISALGAPDFLQGVTGVRLKQLPELTTKKALFLLQKKRGDFYIYNRSSIHYLLKTEQFSGLKTHPNCCGGQKPLYLGFSKNSPHFAGSANPDFDPTQAMTAVNYPVILEKESLAYQFQQALKEMALSGWTEQLYAQYYQ